GALELWSCGVSVRSLAGSPHHSISPPLHHSNPLKMSRIGRLPIDIPAKVKVEVQGRKVFVEGPKGKLDFNLPRRTSAAVAGAKSNVSRDGDDAEAKALHGLSRVFWNNLVKGCSEGSCKRLEVHGVGF